MDGQTLITDKASILNRWIEHFQTLFSGDRTVDDSVIQPIPQQPMKEELDEAPTLEEVIKATDQLKGGKAAGVDGIPPEILSTVAKHFTPNFMNSSYAARNRENYHKTSKTLSSSPCTTVQEQRRKVRLLKLQGGNSPLHRRQNLLKRLVPAVAEHDLPESQFRANRSITDMVFVLRQLQEKMPSTEQ